VTVSGCGFNMGGWNRPRGSKAKSAHGSAKKGGKNGGILRRYVAKAVIFTGKDRGGIGDGGGGSHGTHRGKHLGGVRGKPRNRGWEKVWVVGAKQHRLVDKLKGRKVNILQNKWLEK